MGKDLTKVGKLMYFCGGGSCLGKGAERLFKETRAMLKTGGLYPTTHIVKTFCNGQCEHGPVMVVQPDNIWYRQMDERKLEKIVRDHIIGNQPVREFALYTGDDNICHEPSPVPFNPPKHFESREVEGWGLVQAANMDAWEMNLYPFMKDLFINRFQGLQFLIPVLSEQPFSMDRPGSIEYDGVRVTVTISTDQFSFVIGFINENNPEYALLNQQKITDVSFCKKASPPGGTLERGIVIKNRSGGCIMEVRFPFSDDAIHTQLWDHYSRIYLEII